MKKGTRSNWWKVYRMSDGRSGWSGSGNEVLVRGIMGFGSGKRRTMEIGWGLLGSGGGKG
jgi:hypothetical protein